MQIIYPLLHSSLSVALLVTAVYSKVTYQNVVQFVPVCTSI